MRHHAEDVATLVDDSRDAVLGAVDVGVRTEFTFGVRISEDNTAFILERLENIARCDVPAFAVRDGNA
jgi:hypothetical protein